MTEANNIPTIEDDDDINTTAPQSDSHAWKMPEPVFQRTSGKLPKGYEKDAGFSGSDTTHTSVQPVSVSEAEPKPKSPTLKLVVVALGLLGMVAFIAAFLTVVYFYFLR